MKQIKKQYTVNFLPFQWKYFINPLLETLGTTILNKSKSKKVGYIDSPTGSGKTFVMNSCLPTILSNCKEMGVGSEGILWTVAAPNKAIIEQAIGTYLPYTLKTLFEKNDIEQKGIKSTSSTSSCSYLFSCIKLTIVFLLYKLFRIIKRFILIYITKKH